MWLIKKTNIALVIARVKPVTGLSAASDVTAGVTAFLASITIWRVFFPLVRLKDRQVRANFLSRLCQATAQHFQTSRPCAIRQRPEPKVDNSQINKQVCR